MLRRIIIAHDHLEATAATNRILGFAKGYQQCGAEVYLILYTAQFNPKIDIEGVNVILVGENKLPFRVLRRFVSMFRYIREIKKYYVKGETAIQIRSTPWWGIFFNRHKYSFFYERGEIPFYVKSKSILYRIQERIGLWESRFATGMLAQTFAIKDYYSQHGVKNIEVINMFVDKERFRDIPAGDGTKYIAYCGVLSKQKDGIDDLIRAFSLVHKEFQEYKLYLIGGFDSLYGDEEALLEMISNLGLTESVVITGKVSPGQIPALLCNASVLALARHNNKQTMYGFPTKLGEYLCTGKPVVLTPVGEIGMYLKDMETCVFAEPDHYEDFADKLKWVISNYDRALQIGESGRILVDTCFSIPTEAKKAMTFMDSVSLG